MNDPNQKIDVYQMNELNGLNTTHTHKSSAEIRNYFIPKMKVK